MQYEFMLVGNDLKPKVIGRRPDYKTVASAVRGLVFKADKVFGKTGWHQVRNQTIIGFYARANDNSACLSLELSPWR